MCETWAPLISSVCRKREEKSSQKASPLAQGLLAALSTPLIKPERIEMMGWAGPLEHSPWKNSPLRHSRTRFRMVSTPTEEARDSSPERIRGNAPAFSIRSRCRMGQPVRPVRIDPSTPGRCAAWALVRRAKRLAGTPATCPASSRPMRDRAKGCESRRGRFSSRRVPPRSHPGKR
jgi:hypothetical protein